MTSVINVEKMVKVVKKVEKVSERGNKYLKLLLVDEKADVFNAITLDKKVYDSIVNVELEGKEVLLDLSIDFGKYSKIVVNGIV